MICVIVNDVCDSHGHNARVIVMGNARPTGTSTGTARGTFHLYVVLVQEFSVKVLEGILL